MKKIVILWLLGVFLGCIDAGATLFSSNTQIGALLGPSVMNNNVGTKFAVGANFDTLIAPNLGAGLYFTYNSLGSVGNSSSSLVNALAEGKYFWDDLIKGLNLGFKAGPGFSSTSTTVTGQGSTSGTDLVFGPSVGLDVPLSQNLSLGGETNLLFVTSSSSLTLFNFVGALRYWL